MLIIETLNTMYDIQSELIIYHWTMLEDQYDKASVTLHNKLQNTNITISNNNEMKYLDVCISNYTNSLKTFEQFTHIHSFINNMKAFHGDNVFNNYVIKYNSVINKKRFYNDIGNNQEAKLKRTKCE